MTREEAAQKLEELDQRVTALANGLVNANETIDDLEKENNRLRDRVTELEQRVSDVEPTDAADGKEGKVAEIVRYADRKRDAEKHAVVVKPDEIRGVAGCSLRYAYDLIDDIAADHGWARRNTDRDHAAADARGLFVRFNADDRPTVPLNKFNNGNGGDAP
jgi:uncharacterized coiled-coil protein SlyX